ncbi:MAG: GNAT family N-acetyltransferase [Gemmatimonadota bacterium]
MSIRRPDPRHPGGDTPLEEDPLASAFWIRTFLPTDAREVRELVFGVLEEFGLAPDHAGTDVDLSDVERHYQARGGEFWVVEDGRGRVVGTCGLWLDSDDPDRSELRKMYLRPEWRGRGLGGQLLEIALSHARGAGRGRVELETNRAMTAAIGLYESRGFREIEGDTCARCDRRFALDLE